MKKRNVSVTRSPFSSLLRLLIAVETPGDYEFILRLLSELQTILILGQLCINTNLNSSYQGSAILDIFKLDLSLSLAIKNVGMSFWAILISLYEVSLILLLSFRIIIIKKKLRENGAFEYNLLVLHISFISYYVNVLIFQELYDNFNGDNNWWVLWIILIVLNLALGILGARFSINFLRTPNRCSTQSSNYYSSGWIHKNADLLIRTIILNNSKNLLRVIVGCIFLTYRALILKGYNFHHFSTQKIFYFLYGVQLSFIIGGIVDLSYNYASEEASFAVYLAILLSLLLGYNFWSKQDEILINSTSKLMEKSENFELRINVVDHIFSKTNTINLQENSKLNFMLLLTFCSKDSSIIPNTLDEPALRDLLEIKIQDFLRLFQKMHEFLIDKLFTDWKVKKPNDNFVKLSHVNFRMKSQSNKKYSSIIDLMSLVNSKSGYIISILASKLLEQIYSENFEKTKQGQSLTVQYAADYIITSSNFIDQIKSTSTKYLRFWSESHSKVHILDIFDKAHQLDREAREIEQVWDFLRSEYQSRLKSEYLLYSIFLDLIRHQPLESLKIFKRMNDLVLPTSKNNFRGVLDKYISTNEGMTFIIERVSDKSERIIYLGKAIEYFGYSRAEVKSKGISLLIPEMYKDSGTFNFMNFIQNDSIFGKQFKICLKSRRNILSLMDCYLSVLNNSQTFTFMVIMDFDKSLDTSILLNGNGELIAWTDELEKQLNISTFQEKKELKLDAIFDYMNLSRERLNRIESRMSTVSTPKQILKSKTMKKDKSCYNYNQNQDILLTATMELNVKNDIEINYIAKRSKQFDSSKYFLYELTRKFEDQDDNIEDDLIPNEKLTKFQKKNTHASKIFSVTVKTEKSDSSLYKIKDDLLSKKHLKQKTSSQSTNMIKVDQFDRDLEFRLYKNSENSSHKKINYSVVAYIFLASILSIIYLLASLNKVDKIPILSKSLITVNLRHLNLWEWIYFDAITLLFIFEGLFEDRQDYTPEEYFQSCHSIWGNLNALMKEYDTELINNIPYFEESLQHKFFTPVRIRSRDNSEEIQEGTLFSLDRMIMDAGYRMVYLGSMTIADQDPYDPKLYFMVNNVLDDQFVVEEMFYEVINEDVTIKLQSINRFGQIICYVLTSYGILLFGFILMKSAHAIGVRTAFAESIYKITEYDLESHLKKVSNFCNNFENCLDVNDFYKKVSRESSKKILESKKPAKSNSITSIKISGLNQKILILIILIFSFEFIVVLISYINLIIISQSQDIISKSIHNSIRAAILMNEMTTLVTGLYPYIFFNQEITIKNRPFNEVWDVALQDWATSQDFYKSLLDQIDPDLAEILYAHFTTNLCDLLPDSCYEPVIPIMRNGAFGLYAFLVKATTSLKIEIDQSDKSFDDYKRILYTEDFVNMEWSTYVFPEETKVFMKILQTQVERSVEKFRSSMKISVSCFVVGILIFLLFVWKPIKKSLNFQQKQIGDTLKMIPSNVFKHNISVKAFWTKFSHVKS